MFFLEERENATSPMWATSIDGASEEPCRGVDGEGGTLLGKGSFSN